MKMKKSAKVLSQRVSSFFHVNLDLYEKSRRPGCAVGVREGWRQDG